MSDPDTGCVSNLFGDDYIFQLFNIFLVGHCSNFYCNSNWCRSAGDRVVVHYCVPEILAIDFFRIHKKFGSTKGPCLGYMVAKIGVGGLFSFY